jgi:hypothetical protein
MNEEKAPVKQFNTYQKALIYLSSLIIPPLINFVCNYFILKPTTLLEDIHGDVAGTILGISVGTIILYMIEKKFIGLLLYAIVWAFLTFFIMGIVNMKMIPGGFM